MPRRFIVALLLLTSASIHACSEAVDSGPAETAATEPTIGDDAASEDAPATSTSHPDAAPIVPVDAGSASLVILNEVSASDEWVELVNTGSAAVDISGFGITDSDKDGGGPKAKDVVHFPAGTILSPNSYVVVQGGPDDAGKTCPSGGQSYCVLATWGISNKDGETMYFVTADNGVVGSAVYPAAGAASGESWGRIPSGAPTGVFAINVPTPGATNQAK